MIQCFDSIRLLFLALLEMTDFTNTLKKMSASHQLTNSLIVYQSVGICPITAKLFTKGPAVVGFLIIAK